MGETDQASDDGVPPESEGFALFEWVRSIPLCDDIWLEMQAQNIAIVDFAIIRHLEREALQEYMRRERTPTDVLMPLSALSQMWVFSLYEFLRTWRQRAAELIKLADGYRALDKTARAAFLASEVEKAKKKEQHVRFDASSYSKNVKRVSNVKFIASLRKYFDATERLFREAESLRVTLAKHEIPKTPGFIAEAPGYGRMNYHNGSMYWFITLKDGSYTQVDRRELADVFLGLEEERATEDESG